MESAKEKWGWLPKSKITGDAVSPKEKWLGYLMGPAGSRRPSGLRKTMS